MPCLLGWCAPCPKWHTNPEHLSCCSPWWWRGNRARPLRRTDHQMCLGCVLPRIWKDWLHLSFLRSVLSMTGTHHPNPQLCSPKPFRNTRTKQDEPAAVCSHLIESFRAWQALLSQISGGIAYSKLPPIIATSSTSGSSCAGLGPPTHPFLSGLLPQDRVAWQQDCAALVDKSYYFCHTDVLTWLLTGGVWGGQVRFLILDNSQATGF